jgi:acetyl-CoA C-acetyltransferase
VTIADPIVIAGAARTPLGKFQGELSSLAATELGTVAIKAALERAQVSPDAISEVLMGCVLPAGLGQAPARQAARHAGIPDAAGATTVNKVCGSGMKAAMLAHDLLKVGSADIVVAGGMESMTNAPYLLKQGRGGYRIGHGQVFDHLMLDGLEDAYDKGRSMGTFGEDCAEQYQFTRDLQDEYAMESVRRARQAQADGAFAREIVKISVPAKTVAVEVARDEHAAKLDPAKIPSLKPAFKKDGTITAAASSANADGAAALVLTRRSVAEKNGMPIIATIVGHASHAQEPAWFTTAPIPAIKKLLEKTGWKAGDVDLYEINEAFAVVAMAAIRDLGLRRDQVNVHGGAVALGHPIGATGARIIVTLLHALETHGMKRGIASLCIGGGEATAVAVERAN